MGKFWTEEWHRNRNQSATIWRIDLGVRGKGGSRRLLQQYLSDSGLDQWKWRKQTGFWIDWKKTELIESPDASHVECESRMTLRVLVWGTSRRKLLSTMKGTAAGRRGLFRWWSRVQFENIKFEIFYCMPEWSFWRSSWMYNSEFKRERTEDKDLEFSPYNVSSRNWME